MRAWRDGRLGGVTDKSTDGPWSEVRLEHMSAYDISKYDKIAGLDADAAFPWWERYVFPREVVSSLRDGLTPDQAVQARESARSERRKQMRIEEENQREAKAEHQREADQVLLEPIVALADDEIGALSELSKELIAQVTGVDFDGTDVALPEQQLVVAAPGVFVGPGEAIQENGENLVDFAATLQQLLALVRPATFERIRIGGLDPDEAARLLSDPHYWPTTLAACGAGNSVLINGWWQTAGTDGWTNRAAAQSAARTDEPSGRTCDHVADGPCRITVAWSTADEDGDTEFGTHEFPALRERAEREGWEINAIGTDCTDLWPLLAVITERSPTDQDAPTLNGDRLFRARTPHGEDVLVPDDSVKGVVTEFYSDASWLPGGPVVFDQNEGIYSYDGVYWARSVGDSEADCVCVGPYPNWRDGVSAAAEASSFHYVDQNGDIRCELDDWPNDE
jgi:hypothetical protein